MPKRRITAKRRIQILKWQAAGVKSRKGRRRLMTPRGKLVTAYHHTSFAAARQIASEGFKPGNMSPREINKVFFTNRAQDSIVPHLRNGIPQVIRAQLGVTPKTTIPSGVIIGVTLPAAALHRDKNMGMGTKGRGEYFWKVNAQNLKGRKITRQVLKNRPTHAPRMVKTSMGTFRFYDD